MGEVGPKKSLLEKYDIPIEHLSYDYTSQCKNVKELERIINILRSGEEGYYPDLTKHAEEHLRALKPENTVLRIAEPVLTKEMLSPEKRLVIEEEIGGWLCDMTKCERDLNEGRKKQIDQISEAQIPVRQLFDPSKNKMQNKKEPWKNSKTEKRILACDYAGWDKYDADTELNRIDIRSEQERVLTKREQLKRREKVDEKFTENLIDKQKLTKTELSVLAEKEREKGNEAFKAADYEEALHFYNSSIAINGTINSYNNRAITLIKLKNYSKSIEDCDYVLKADSTNIKALVRRGFAYESLDKKSQSLADFETVLKLEPANKTAIAAINRLGVTSNSKKNWRLKIEDVSSPRNEKEVEIPINSVKSVKKTVLKNITQSSSFLPDEICFCNNTPRSSRQSLDQPHLRNSYCPETPQCSFNGSYSQNIFNYSEISSENSSVIIEELPNEKCESLPNDHDKLSNSRTHMRSEGKIAKKNSNFSTEIKVDKEKNGNFEKTSRPKNLDGIIEDRIGKISETEPNSVCPEQKKYSNIQTDKKLEKSFNSPPEIQSNEDKNENLRKTSRPKNLDGNIENETGKISETESKPKTRARIFDTKRIERVQKPNGKLSEETICESAPKTEENCKISKSGINPVTENSRLLDENSDRKFDHIESPYEFLRAWHCYRKDGDLFQQAQLLRSFSASNIDTVVGNKLDGEMMGTILRCLKKHFATLEDSNKMIELLRYLAKVERFSIVKMFMNDDDKKVLKEIFSFLEKQGFSDSAKELRTVYGIRL